MLKFNNNHIFTGYIKQLLASFNLPMCKVYSNENYVYKNINGHESPEIIKTIIDNDNTDQKWPPNMRFIPYIKDNRIQEYIYSTNAKGQDVSYWKTIDSYYFNKKRLNRTKNLKIKNNIYDSYTHEYLGDYLRFIRDYFNIDLMPLYNCFSNVICSNIVLDYFDKSSDTKFSFNSFDDKYKIYILPVKLFKDYTIAIDCKSQIEMCCCIFGKYLDMGKNNEFKSIIGDTYSKIGNASFNKPFLYTKLKSLCKYTGIDNINELARREGDLKLLIKIPAANVSSITILEGNYLGWNDKLIQMDDTKLKVYKNHTITNFEDFDYVFNKQRGGIISAADYESSRIFTPITELQLLRYNAKESYPFADRLIEYLIGNVITNEDAIGDNIARAQEVIASNSKIDNSLPTGEQSGLWDARMRPELYNKMQNLTSEKIVDGDNITYINGVISKNSKNVLEKNHDILGYIDKDVEVVYTGTRNNEPCTIASVDIYDEIYRDDKIKEV